MTKCWLIFYTCFWKYCLCHFKAISDRYHDFWGKNPNFLFKKNFGQHLVNKKIIIGGRSEWVWSVFILNTIVIESFLRRTKKNRNLFSKILVFWKFRLDFSYYFDNFHDFWGFFVKMSGGLFFVRRKNDSMTKIFGTNKLQTYPGRPLIMIFLLTKCWLIFYTCFWKYGLCHFKAISDRYHDFLG